MKTRLLSIIIFIGPSMALMFTFLLIPIFVSFFLSLTNFDAFAMYDWSKANFIGFENFTELFQDELFWKALFNTLYCLIVALPVTVILALGSAILLNREQTYFKSFFKVSYYLTFVTNTVAIAIVWRWILNSQYGIMNYLLGLFGIEGQNWLGDPVWAMPSVIMLVVWRAIGYNMILFLAGLQNIPEYLYEVAELDGASRWQKFFYITLPMLRPTMLFVTVMMMIGYLQLFQEPYMLTGGGPLNSTLSIVLYLYEQGFQYFNLGYASTIAVVLFLIIMGMTLLRMRATKST
ncbi:MAG: sugar ABC transporter permease [Kosmotogaceae bacterium]